MTGAREGRYLDFDQMMRELRREKVTLRVFGEEHQIEARIPASLVLELMRHEEKGGVPPSLLFEAGERLFGEAAMREWLGRGEFSIDMLAELVKAAFELINGGEPAGAAPVTEDDPEGYEKN